MKLIFTLLLLLQFFSSNAQKLVSFEVLPCEETIGLNFYKNRLITKSHSHDTLYLHVGFVDNCEILYKGNLENKKDSMFLNFENISEGYMACNCLFFMDIVISEVSDTSRCIYINNEEYLFSKKYVDLPPETIRKKDIKNRIDQNGLKIGLWKNTSKSGSYSIAFYEKGIASWRKSYNSNGKLTGVQILFQFEDEATNYSIGPEEYEKMLRENDDY
jgi:hypothetical protein